MDIKKRLVKRLLEDISYKSFFLQNYRLATYLGSDVSEIESFLNELANKNILTVEIQYECHVCGENIGVNSFKLEHDGKQKSEIICPRCYEPLDVTLNRTGSIYYNIIDRDSLKQLVY